MRKKKPTLEALWMGIGFALGILLIQRLVARWMSTSSHITQLAAWECTETLGRGDSRCNFVFRPRVQVHAASSHL